MSGKGKDAVIVPDTKLVVMGVCPALHSVLSLTGHTEH